MNRIFYNLFLAGYSAAVRLASLWNPKAKSWVQGRKNWEYKIAQWRSETNAPEPGSPENTNATSTNNSTPSSVNANDQSKVIWMHCASLGEFEQGRPLLEAIGLQYPNHKIVLTFFSPSGYNIRKNYAGAHLIMYLPMDSPTTARAFIDAVNPSLVLWVKYEYWFYYLRELKNREIPVLLISGIFRESQPFFKWYGNFWRGILPSFAQMFVQTSQSEDLLNAIGIKEKIVVAGDTRFDRVVQIAEKWEPLGDEVAQFCGNHPVLVAGSTWEEDEELLIHYAKVSPEIKFIIAPHEVSPERIGDLQKEFPHSILYSTLSGDLPFPLEKANVLIIDNMGILSRLYKYASITYVGGGFNKSGIHNILEAAVYGKPVIFGQVYEKFAEARELVEIGGAFSVDDALDLENLLNSLFEDSEALEKSSLASKEFVYGQRGATSKILSYIERNRLLTS
jgi:3-deoxy-D-manno-octulosonic-acid transferase